MTRPACKAPPPHLRDTMSASSTRCPVHEGALRSSSRSNVLHLCATSTNVKRSQQDFRCRCGCGARNPFGDARGIVLTGQRQRRPSRDSGSGSDSTPRDDVKSLDDTAVTAAAAMAAKNCYKQLEAMLKKEDKLSVIVNAKDADRDRTPLHWAAARGHMKSIEVLLGAGADTMMRDAHGQTPAQLALALDQKKAHARIAHGPVHEDPKVLDGLTSISMLSALAATNQYHELRALVRPGGLDPNRKDSDGDRTPLHWASARGHVGCIKLLLNAGADLGVLDKTGSTAAGLAFEYGQTDAHDLLMAALRGEWVAEASQKDEMINIKPCSRDSVRV